MQKNLFLCEKLKFYTLFRQVSRFESSVEEPVFAQ